MLPVMREPPPVAAVILAAGRGQRMHSDLPKVLQPVARWTLLRHVLGRLQPLRPARVIMVTGQGMEAVEEEARRVFPNAETVLQPTPLGTGNAVRQAEAALTDFTGSVLVLYGDTPFVPTAVMRRMTATLEEAEIAVLGFTPTHPAAYGRLLLNAAGELEAIREARDATEAERRTGLCNAGAMAVRGTHLFSLLRELKNDNSRKEYYLTDIVAVARLRGLRCRVVQAEEREVMGVNTQAERTEAERLAQADLRRQALEAGVALVDPETVFLCPDTVLAPGSTVHPYVVFGPGVTVGRGAEIHSFSHIEGAAIAENARVGPFARLRPGTEIGRGAHVGNFVELKKTRMGEGAKANHLSYLGDASVGAGANIGAGAITCNYDGYRKHRTDIGRGAFVGSNASLVAPVTIGEGAIVGAGSVIRENVPAEALAVMDNAQKNVPGKARNFRKKRE